MIHSAINNASIATASVHPIENGSLRTRAISFVVYGIILAAARMCNQIYSQIAYISTNPNFSSDQLSVQALSTGSEALPQRKGLFVGKSEPSFWHCISPG